MISKAPKAPLIDGELEQEVWTSATTSGEFWLSAEQRLPTDRTEVLVLADDENLYFGFRCYDSQPESIYAIKTRHYAGLGNDDRVSIELDPFHDHRTVSTYSVNVLGTQNDAIAGGRARKIEWKGDWQAAAVRTDYGWSAEIAIPFSILNYPVGAEEFGINFVRYQHRTDEWAYWSDVTPQFLKEEMGQLTGLKPPAIAKTQPWTLMPYALAGANAPDIDGEIQDQLYSAGTDIRYEPRPNLTGVASLYPDFSQLETQVTNIDFSYTEKFRADPRPFFQEGSAYLGPDRQYFYSNRVPDFYAGLKGFGQWSGGKGSFPRSGQIKIGGLVTRAPDNRWDGAFRLVREFDARHAGELMLVATEREALDNQLLVAQLGGRQVRGAFYNADLAYSDTQRQEFKRGGSFRGTTGWQEDYWSVDVSADYYDTDYFPANGLLGDDRYGTRNLSASASYYRDLYQGPYRSVTGSIGVGNREAFEDSVTQNRNLFVTGGVEMRRQISVDLEYFKGDYRPREGERGQFSETVNNDHYWGLNLNFNTRSSVFSYGAYYANGFLGGDDYQYFAPYVWGKPTGDTVVSLTYEQLDNFGRSEQTILRAGWDITNQDGIVGRVIWQDDENYERLAYRRTVRSGMDLFAVYDQEPGADKKFSVKAVWTIQ